MEKLYILFSANNCAHLVFVISLEKYLQSLIVCLYLTNFKDNKKPQFLLSWLEISLKKEIKSDVNNTSE